MESVILTFTPKRSARYHAAVKRSKKSYAMIRITLSTRPTPEGLLIVKNLAACNRNVSYKDAPQISIKEKMKAIDGEIATRIASGSGIPTTYHGIVYDSNDVLSGLARQLCR